MTWGGGRSETQKQLVVNNDLSSPELILLLFRKHLQGDNKEDYEIRKSVVSDLGTREDLLIFFSFYTLVIYHVIISRSNKCTSNVVG